MKNHIIYFIASLIFSFLIGCKNEEVNLSAHDNNGSVVFELNNNSNNRLKTTQTPSSILLTLTDSEGNILYSSKEIELVDFGGSYKTNAFPLKQGNYIITEYLIVNSNSEVIYATPKQDAELAYLVDEPLPISFNVETDNISNLNPEVISTENISAEDLGYATFELEIVETFSFNVAVMVFDQESNSFQLTNSTLQVYYEDALLLEEDLSDETSGFRIKSGDQPYKVIVSKEGYIAYEMDYSMDDLNEFNDENPLIIQLQKAE